MSNIISLKIALEKIILIEKVIEKYKYITKALEDELLGRPSILMHLVSLAEQFSRLKSKNANDILNNFEKEDLKGTYDIRNFIAHDYEDVNLALIELIIKEKLPKIKSVIIKVLKENNE